MISNDNEILNAVEKFRSLLLHLHGAGSPSVVLRNNQGHVATTAVSSKDLFDILQPQCSVVKLMVGFLKNLIHVNKDGGLFTAILSSSIITKMMQEKVPLMVSATAMDLFLSRIRYFIKGCKQEFNIGSLQNLRKLFKPILQSKMILTKKEFEHICLLFGKAFAKTSNSQEGVEILLNDCGSITDSSLFDGVLLSLERPNEELDPKKRLKVLLVSVGISLDSEDLLADSSINMTVKSLNSLQDEVFSRLLMFCELVRPHVDLIICQKVVHPLLKEYFRDHGVLCIDRIGIRFMKTLEDIFECKRLSSLFINDVKDFIGICKSLTRHDISGRHFVQVQSCEENSCKTLLLSAATEHEVNILSTCFEACMSSLKFLVHEPYVVCGSGCMETRIAMHLFDSKQSEDINQCDELPYTKVVEVGRILGNSFLDIASSLAADCTQINHYLDTETHHHWVNPNSTSECCCGLTKKSGQHFMGFIEMREMTLCSRQSRKEGNTEELNLLSQLVMPSGIYSRNVDAAFELAHVVLRIGMKIEEK